MTAPHTLGERPLVLTPEDLVPIEAVRLPERNLPASTSGEVPVAYLADHGLDGRVETRLRDGRPHATVRSTGPIDALAADLDQYSFSYEVAPMPRTVGVSRPQRDLRRERS